MDNVAWPGIKTGFAVVIRDARNEPVVAIDDPTIIRAVLELLLDRFGLDVRSRPEPRGPRQRVPLRPAARPEGTEARS